MKMTKIILSVLGLFMVSWTVALSTVDLPVFYRAPFFQGEGRHKFVDWSTKIMVRYGGGWHTGQSMSGQSKRQVLLNCAGPLDIARLGLGMMDTTAVSKPVTDSYWGDSGNTWNGPSTKFPSRFTPTGNDGKINLSGMFATQDLGFELTQSIKYGFYGQAYVPLRWVKVTDLGYENKGAALVNGVSVADFFQNDFDTILRENGMQPLKTSFNKSGLADVTAAFGWQGYGKIGSKWLMDLGGNLQMGGIFPIAKQLDKTNVAAIPLGYNNSYGTFARLNAEIGVFDWIAVGAYADAILFFNQRQTLQMRTDESQSGWLRLGAGFAQINSGTLWNGGGYIRLGAFVPGLTLFGGYSFTRQEDTKVSVMDSNFNVLLTKFDVVTQAIPPGLMPSTDSGDQDAVVKADPRFHAWEAHVLHFGATFEIGGSKAIFSPRLQIEYNYPFDGRMIFKTPMVRGTAGLQFSFGF